ncbi:RNA-splicing ligase RtcB [bacterium BMS3Bbin14]|nr:RNA-splicing ligase RtcB [bacterium BMS3Abin13]GBE53240.1 RNA-splicing ligase RtcB [bacterium BMS3Bbin14]
MKQIITTEKRPIKLWLDDIDDGAMGQARNLANLPFVYKHIAVMPDAHLGYGMPIGGVMATEDVVIPNAVGVDIGCGMCALQTSLTDISNDQLKAIIKIIRRTIPLGFKHHKARQSKALMPKTEIPLEELPLVSQEYNSALTQLGTLGGGNHFIEIQKGSDGHIWIMIHSGSRNLGFKVANYYNRLAVQLNARWGSTIPGNWQLAFLPLSSEAGRQYVHEMNYCVEFALANRKLMMERVKEAFRAVASPVSFSSFINIAHNYAAMETHFHKQVIVHRKGATSAREGEMGIIPGSQGTPSYIVRGKGNSESFESCSHGAGRKMGRKQAQRQLDLEAEVKKLDNQGIIHSIRGRRDLDEAAGAYKNIDQVIENQIDLVEVVVTLHPLAVIKG